MTLPKEIIERLLEVGEVEWGKTAALDADDHAAHIKNSVEITADHFGQTGPQEMHGLYIKGTGIVVCHTGTSPNSPQHACILAGAWNQLYALAAAAREGGDVKQAPAESPQSGPEGATPNPLKDRDHD